MSAVRFDLDKKAQQLNGVGTPPKTPSQTAQSKTPSKPLYKNLVSPVVQTGPNGTPLRSPMVRLGTPQHSPHAIAGAVAIGTPPHGPHGQPVQPVQQGGTPKKLVAANPKPRRKYDYSAYKHHDFSKEEMSQLLEKYIEVPQTQWANLPRGTHIRYMKKDGKFARGGFIKNTYLLHGKQTIQLETGNDSKAPGYVQFPVVLENLSNVWRLDPSKEPGAPQVAMPTPQKNNGTDGVDRMETMEHVMQVEMELRELKGRGDSHDARINKLEDAVKHIVATLTRKFGAQRPTQSPGPSANGQR